MFVTNMICAYKHKTFIISTPFTWMLYQKFDSPRTSMALRDCYICYFFFHHSCVKFIILIGLIQNSNLVVTWPAACINIICFIRSSVRNLIDLRWTFENTKMCFAPWRLLFAGSSRWRIHRISVYHETKNKKDDWAMIIIWRKRFFFFFVLLICNQL